MSALNSIQGQKLEIIVVGCNKLKDTELFSRQDPYVYFEYGTSNYRTETCTNGGRDPTFGDKFYITLIQGLREINASVWNRNKFTNDHFIGNGRIQLETVLAEGFDDSVWQLQTKNSRYAGDLKLIMRFPKASFQNYYPTCSSPPAAYAPPNPASYPTYPPPTAAPYSGSASPPQAPPPPQTYPPTAPPQPQQEPLISSIIKLVISKLLDK